jgi:hypothetical protein
VDAREQLRTAHDTLSAVGAVGFAERARHELLATGETVRKRRDDTRDELTPQEEHIARLALAGRTNSESGTELFISPVRASGRPLRELIPSFVNTFFRCHSTVRGDSNPRPHHYEDRTTYRWGSSEPGRKPRARRSAVS